MFSKQLLLLLNGLSHTETSSLHKIYANFSFAAAAVGFSSNASWWNIEDVTGLKVQMRRYVFPPHLFQDCRFRAFSLSVPKIRGQPKVTDTQY